MREYYAYEPEEEEKKRKKTIFSKIDKWEVFKNVATMAASGCATVMVNKYLKASMPDSKGIFDKVVTGIGAYFVTGLIGSKVAEYCDKELESMRENMMKPSLPKGDVNGE